MSKWIEISPSYYFKLPAKPGCYVIYLDGKLAYIGQTRSIRKRFGEYNIRPGYGGGEYHTPWGTVEQITAKCRYAERLGDQAMRELRLIHRLRPPLNCVGGPRKARKAGEHVPKDRSRYGGPRYYQSIEISGR